MSQAEKPSAGFCAQNAKHKAPRGRTTRHSSAKARSRFATVSNAHAQVTTSNWLPENGNASSRPVTRCTGRSEHLSSIAAEGSRTVMRCGARPSATSLRTKAPVPQPASSNVLSGVATTRVAASKAAWASPPAARSHRRCKTSYRGARRLYKLTRSPDRSGGGHRDTGPACPIFITRIIALHPERDLRCQQAWERIWPIRTRAVPLASPIRSPERRHRLGQSVV